MKTFWFVVLVFLTVLSANARAHNHHDENDESSEGAITPIQATPSFTEIRVKINESYLRDVRPILEAKCFHCHGKNTNMPWYYAIPGVHQFLDSHIKDGMKHLDLSSDYPFKGKAHEFKDFEELLEERDMPPWSYRLMHPKSRMKPEDWEKLKKWITDSKQLMEQGASGSIAPAAPVAPHP